MAEEKKPRLIKRIDLLVHPFYSVLNDLYAEPESKVIRLEKPARLKMKKLAKYWGVRVKQLAEDPSAILIFIRTDYSPRHARLLDPRVLQEQKLLAFAKKSLGERVLVLTPAFSKTDFADWLCKKKFALDCNALRGKSFGEYVNYCVTSNLIELKNFLDKPQAKFTIDRKLSVGGLYAYRKFGKKRKRFRK